jgi:tetratricopeptide (TPR) repeat protein
MGFFSSLFSSSKNEDSLDEQQKENLKNFDILKYDGIRAQRMGKPDYAVRCFVEALKIREDFETMQHLVSAYYAVDRFEDSLAVLDSMVAAGQEPVNTLLARVGILQLLDRHAEAAADCMKVTEIESDNYLAYFQMAKSERALNELSGSIGHLTRAVNIKDNFVEGYMLRADIYLSLKKGGDALPDVEKAIALAPENEAAYLLRGRIHELMGDMEAAFPDYQHASELDPFNEDAYLLAGRLMMVQDKYEEAIALFDEAIEHNDQFAKAYAERGHANDILAARRGRGGENPDEPAPGTEEPDGRKA